MEGKEDILELCDDMGYKNLQLKSQNLRDQASRLEKIRNNGIDLSIRERSVEDLGNITSRSEYSSQENIENENQNNQSRESGNANSLTRGQNLRSAVPQQIPEEIRVTMGDWPDVSDDVPEYLPNYTTVNLPTSVNWGRNSNGRMITLTTATIDDAYNEVTTWRKNTFLVPYGKTGRDFIDQLTKHIDDWNNRSPMQYLALKAVTVLLAVALQKPGQRSKAKEHQECLEKRLTLWRNGEIESLLREGRMIQRRLSKFNKNDPSKSNKNDPTNKARIFAKLVMEGQINSALRYLSEDGSGGVLPLTDDAMRQLKEKHPVAQRAKLGSLLFGPVEDIPDAMFQGINGELVREAALRTKGSGGPSGVDRRQWLQEDPGVQVF